MVNLPSLDLATWGSVLLSPAGFLGGLVYVLVLISPASGSLGEPAQV